MEFQYVLLILVVVYSSSQSEPPTPLLLRVAIRIQRSWTQGTKLLPSPCFFLRCFTSFATFIILCDHGSFPLCPLSYYACSQFLLLSVYKRGVSSALFASTGLCIIGSPFKILILSIHQHPPRPQTKRSRTLYISIARMMPLE